MAQPAALTSIENELVDQVVANAVLLLIETDACRSALTMRDGEDDVMVAVYCDAQQQSAVILRCTQPLAVNLASRMLELAPDEVCEVDLLDATGELVNVIAGNLRGLISSPGTMSPPFELASLDYARFEGSAATIYDVVGEGMEVLRF